MRLPELSRKLTGLRPDDFLDLVNELEYAGFLESEKSIDKMLAAYMEFWWQIREDSHNTGVLDTRRVFAVPPPHRVATWSGPPTFLSFSQITVSIPVSIPVLYARLFAEQQIREQLEDL